MSPLLVAVGLLVSAPPADGPAAQFEKLKTLEGNWKAGEKDATRYVSLRVISNGTAVLEMVTADLSFAACKKYDLEAWAPGCSEWLEVSSCSTFGDFQARRAMIRMKSGTDKPRYLHTLNGSGLALPRTVIAILENYQRADGSVEIPKVLRPYFGGRDTLAPVTAG